MRRLMLLRHAKTAAESATGRDFDRKLDERGMADAAVMGKWASQQPISVARALVSPATRARQTWEVVCKALPARPEQHSVEELYNASAGQLLHAIHRHGGDASCLMLVAHNPGLHELAIVLSEPNESSAQRTLHDNFPTSGVAVIDFEIEKWPDAQFRGGRLVDLVAPKLLRGAAGEP